MVIFIAALSLAMLGMCNLHAMQQELVVSCCSRPETTPDIFPHLLVFRKLINLQKQKPNPEKLLPFIQDLQALCDRTLSAKILRICLAETNTSFYKIRNHFQETILHCCARENGLLECAKIILQTACCFNKTWELLSATDTWNETALHWATRNGYVEIATMLIRLADVLDKEEALMLIKNRWNQTALDVAAEYDRTDIVQILKPYHPKKSS